MKIKVSVLILLACLALGTIGCDNEGEAEKAGKKIDKAMEDLKK